MFVRNCWYVAAWDYEVEPGALFSINLIGEPVVIYRSDDDGLVALEDRCCHRFAPLSKGRIEDGCNIRCMYHGLKFDPAGRCIEIPGQDKIPPAAVVRAYPVVEKHSWVWVWMGDPAKADESLIPPAIGLSSPDYIMRSGRIDYDAEYQLLNDNLTDFSHLAYVHANSFGATEAWAQNHPRVRRIDRGIRVSRWMPTDDGLKEQTSVVAKKGRAGMALWQTYDFLVPGILLIYTATHEMKDMPEDGVSAPTGTPVAANFACQAVTPMDEKKTRYFYAWGPRSSDGTDEQADQMFALTTMAFEEDRVMIEAQQKIMDIRPGREVLTAADTGPVQMRSVIRALHKAETAQSMAIAD